MRIWLESLVLGLLATTQHVGAAKVVSFDISRRAEYGIKDVLRRRDLTKSFVEPITNLNAGHGYVANVTVGTPPQPLTLGIDTGSTDTWVLSKTANYCVNKTLIANGMTCKHGTFDANSSSTVKTVVPGGFQASYVDGSGASGDFVEDVLGIGGVEVVGMQMGLAFKSTDEQGTLGLGYDTLENPKTKYPSFIDQLQAQGFINSKAFSLYLNDLTSSTGSILFGGIDTAKFSGTLQTLPLIPALPDGAISFYGVVLVSVTVVSSDTNSTFNLTSTASDGSTVNEIGVVLDSGAMFTYLPTVPVQAIYKLLGAVISTVTPNFVFVDCALLTPPSGIPTVVNFQFTSSTGPIISVPLHELVFPLEDYGVDFEEQLKNHIIGDLPFKETCMLGLLPAEQTGGATILGDTFLRSAYVVYDLESNSVGIAQTVFNVTESNVVEFGVAESSGFPVTSGVGISSTSSAKATGTGSAGGSGGGATVKPTGTGTGSGSASSTSKSAAGNLSPPPFDGRGLVMLGVVGLCSLVGAGLFLA